VAGQWQPRRLNKTMHATASGAHHRRSRLTCGGARVDEHEAESRAAALVGVPAASSAVGGGATARGCSAVICTADGRTPAPPPVCKSRLSY
jgi:hypothetical protein